MLPMLMLQTSELALFNTEPNSANLLPQEATEPLVEFADLLRLGTQLSPEADFFDGQDLPAGGNRLPASAVGGDETIVPETLIEVAIDVPIAAVEARPFATPVDGAAADPRVRVTGQNQPAPFLPVDITARALPLSPQMMTDATATAIGLATTDAAGIPGRSAALPAELAATPALPATPRLAPEVLPVRELQQQPIIPVTTNADSQLLAERQRGPVRPALAEIMSERPGRGLDVTSNRHPALRDMPRDLAPLPVSTSSTQLAQTPLMPQGPIEIASGHSIQPGSIQLTQAPPQSPALPQPPATQASLLLDVPVQDAAWGEQLGQRVQMMASNRLQSAEIRLSPAELGPLRVQVSVDDGATKVTFHAQHALTRDAIEQALPRLRELLAENGLTLDQTHVGDSGVEQGGRDGNDAPARIASSGSESADGQDGDDRTAAAGRVPSSEGLVDTFA